MESKLKKGLKMATFELRLLTNLVALQISKFHDIYGTYCKCFSFLVNHSSFCQKVHLGAGNDVYENRELHESRTHFCPF